MVIPCYNDGPKVRRAVESCLAQTYLPFEVIVIDDNSEEPTRKIVEKLRDDFSGYGVRCIFMNVNSGVSRARNYGIQQSQGDFICFLDADDSWHSQKLAMIGNVIKNYSAAVVAHDFSYDENVFNKNFLFTADDVKRLGFGDVLFKNPITTPSLVVSRALNVQFDEQMKYAEDHDLILRLAKDNPIFFLNLPLVLIDRRLGAPGGLSGNRWKMRKGEMRMFVKMCAARPIFYPILPLFLTYSLLKHVRKMIFSK